MRRRSPAQGGFSAVEVIALAAVLAVLALLVVARIASVNETARRSVCDAHLVKIWLLFENWSIEHGDRELPEYALTNSAAALTAADYFKHLSNSVFHPPIFHCPSDLRRTAAATRPELNDAHISYFARLGSGVRETPAWIAGDRNLLVNDVAPSGLLAIAAGDRLKWGRSMHRGRGALILRDGSHYRPQTVQLEATHPARAGGTNVLLFPQ